jgi:hypothetical protein
VTLPGTSTAVNWAYSEVKVASTAAPGFVPAPRPAPRRALPTQARRRVGRQMAPLAPAGRDRVGTAPGSGPGAGRACAGLGRAAPPRDRRAGQAGRRPVPADGPHAGTRDPGADLAAPAAARCRSRCRPSPPRSRRWCASASRWPGSPPRCGAAAAPPCRPHWPRHRQLLRSCPRRHAGSCGWPVGSPGRSLRSRPTSRCRWPVGSRDARGRCGYRAAVPDSHRRRLRRRGRWRWCGGWCGCPWCAAPDPPSLSGRRRPRRLPPSGPPVVLRRVARPPLTRRARITAPVAPTVAAPWPVPAIRRIVRVLFARRVKLTPVPPPPPIPAWPPPAVRHPVRLPWTRRAARRLARVFGATAPGPAPAAEFASDSSAAAMLATDQAASALVSGATRDVSFVEGDAPVAALQSQASAAQLRSGP